MIDEQPYNALAWFNLAAAYQGSNYLRKQLMPTNLLLSLMRSLIMRIAIWEMPI